MLWGGEEEEEEEEEEEKVLRFLTQYVQLLCFLVQVC